MMKSFGLALSLSVALLATGVLAQISHSMTDGNTGITFQAFTNPQTGFTFGLVVPENVGSDFIGQLVVPTNGSGWGGVSLNGDSHMTDSLMIVAWPYGDEVMHSVRELIQYGAPVYNGSVSLSEIPAGTFINSTHLSLTFLCSGCITNSSLSFSADDATAVMGYAVSDIEVEDPSDPATELTYHDEGAGGFDMDIEGAKSSEYDTWAAMATGGSSSDAVTGAVLATHAGFFVGHDFWDPSARRPGFVR
ncbi:CBD9-like protein [Fistulina hepatica ATCC 64428]|uniref:CBD9-like protein n=1 Tax=Fistulina hepatica ATCC 64428 TaxID=1128425 RepID=A0A0D7AKT3_9AGAR|nr:CBD9-like protein [Fistulina hepatica ATCC 64428]